MVALITGASGFIGSQLALRLANQGIKVVGLYRSNLLPELEQHPNVTLYKGDITQPDTLVAPMKEATVVYHTAALATNWAKDPSLFDRINVEGTRNVLEAAQQHGIQRVVYTSTAAVIGPQQGTDPVNESLVRQMPLFLDYERTKTEAEKLANDFVAKGLEIVTVLPTRVYGPGPENKSNVGTFITRQYLRGKMRFLPGDGQSIGNYVHIEDIVEGHVLAMEKGVSGERYLLGGENASLPQFFEVVAGASGRKFSMFNIPLPILIGVGYGMQAYTAITGKAPLYLPNDIRRYSYNWGVSSEKAMRELGYNPRPMKVGLPQTVEWLLKKGVV